MPTFDFYIIEGKSLRVVKDNRLVEIVKEIEKEYKNGRDHL